nr:perilipin-2 [Chlorocebus sabaeus]
MRLRRQSSKGGGTSRKDYISRHAMRPSLLPSGHAQPRNYKTHAALRGQRLVLRLPIISGISSVSDVKSMVVKSSTCKRRILDIETNTDEAELSGPSELMETLVHIVANAKGAVTGAKDAVTTTVTGAKDSVASTITGVMDKTKGAVTGSVEKTKSVVSGSINTVLGSRMMQLVNSGVENALTKSELLVEQYLPLTEEELEKEAKKVEGFDLVQKPSYYVRLGSLSTKLRSRAYQQALSRVKEAKQKSQETISQLHSTVHLIEFARKNVHSANQKIQDAQDKLYISWVEWKRSIGYDDTDESHCAEHIESRTLEIARNLTQQLQTTCHNLLSNIQGVPQNIQDQAKHMGVMAGDIYSVFRSAASFKEVSDSLLTSSKGQLQKMKESLDDVMDYLVNNTPLNWLVGPFYPQLTESQNAQDQGAEMDKSSQETQRSEHKTH